MLGFLSLFLLKALVPTGFLSILKLIVLRTKRLQITALGFATGPDGDDVIGF